jgi:hypothetical protein
VLPAVRSGSWDLQCRMFHQVRGVLPAVRSGSWDLQCRMNGATVSPGTWCVTCGEVWFVGLAMSHERIHCFAIKVLKMSYFYGT